ncbi:MAG: DnaJ C-terminal domain-containing protein [Clostridia bacterium]
MSEKVENFNGFGEINFEEILNAGDNKNYNSALDLNYKVKISKKEAIEGTKVKMKVKGRDLELAIPQNIKNGQVIVVKGEGERREKQYGNLKIKLKLENKGN